MKTRSSNTTKSSPDNIGSRPRTKPDPDRWAPLPPNPAHIALLRGVLAKRERLSEYEATAFVEMLRSATKRPLSDGQHDWVLKVSIRVHAEPLLTSEKPVLDFGPLPMRPPGRAA